MATVACSTMRTMSSTETAALVPAPQTLQLRLAQERQAGGVHEGAVRLVELLLEPGALPAEPGLRLGLLQASRGLRHEPVAPATKQPARPESPGSDATPPGIDALASAGLDRPPSQALLRGEWTSRPPPTFSPKPQRRPQNRMTLLGGAASAVLPPALSSRISSLAQSRTPHRTGVFPSPSPHRRHARAVKVGSGWAPDKFLVLMWGESPALYFLSHFAEAKFSAMWMSLSKSWAFAGFAWAATS